VCRATYRGFKSLQKLIFSSSVAKLSISLKGI